jgi:UPF0755 protein
MGKYMRRQRTRAERLRKWLTIAIIIFILLIAATIEIWHVYDSNIQPVSDSQKSQLVTIKAGASTTQIAQQLNKDGLIRSAWAFEWYVRSHEVRDDLQAGTYSFTPSQDLASIVVTLTTGKVTTKLVTILPGIRIDQVRSDLINDGFSPTSVDSALQSSQYDSLPALADLPAGASLEGLLYPDSFQKTDTTDPSVIINESLTEMGQHLTPSLQSAFASEGLTTYQGITLASIVMKEVSNPTDQSQVAQVFLKRLSLNMNLDSDVTAYYGAILAGQTPSTTFDSPYNTYLHTGLPPTPISNVTAAVLNTVAHPASTSWLYFVTGDDGTTYFSQTLAQQQANITQYCHKLCSQSSQ